MALQKAEELRDRDRLNSIKAELLSRCKDMPAYHRENNLRPRVSRGRGTRLSSAGKFGKGNFKI